MLALQLQLPELAQPVLRELLCASERDQGQARGGGDDPVRAPAPSVGEPLKLAIDHADLFELQENLSPATRSDQERARKDWCRTNGGRRHGRSSSDRVGFVYTCYERGSLGR